MIFTILEASKAQVKTLQNHDVIRPMKIILKRVKGILSIQKRYLSGAVVFVRYDTNGSFVALTTSDLYLIQCYLAENSVPLMAGREKMVCICID